MPNQELENFIRAQRAQGYADEQIREALAGKGWPESEVSQALAGAMPGGKPEMPPIFDGYRQAWQVFIARPGLYLGLAVLPVVGSAFWYWARTFYLKGLHYQINLENLLGLLAVGLLCLLLPVFATGSMITAVLKRGLQPSAEAVMRAGLAKTPGLLALGLASGLIIGIGFLALIVPGVYFLVALAFAGTLYLDQKSGIAGAIKGSRALVKGYWWSVAVRLWLHLIIVMLVSNLFAQDFNPAGISGPVAASALPLAITQILAFVFSVTYTTVLYEQLKSLKPQAEPA